MDGWAASLVERLDAAEKGLASTIELSSSLTGEELAAGGYVVPRHGCTRNRAILGPVDHPSKPRLVWRMTSVH